MPPAADLHVATYRAMLDEGGCTVTGRVLERPLLGGPGHDDSWWDNLRNTYRRFDSDPLAGVEVRVSFRGRQGQALSDGEGYYSVRIVDAGEPGDALWEQADVSAGSGDRVYPQPVLCVPRHARFGVISDIDDTIIESSITRWTTALKLTFLHNARTRKPLEGVSELYQAFQAGHGGGPNPVFYVSASPWNLYDLLEDFLAHNDIPRGPMLLRDLDFDRASLLHDAGPRAKLEHIHSLIDRYPQLQWVLVGDSGQIDAQLYADTVDKYPGRIISVYIRDVDPLVESRYDSFVGGHIERISQSGVPMLLVKDSNAIAEHARKLGILAPGKVPDVAVEVERDKARPNLVEAVSQGSPPTSDRHAGS